MKSRIARLLLVFATAFAVFSTPSAAGASTIRYQTVECGTLIMRWGTWRMTSYMLNNQKFGDLYVVDFYPRRPGTHLIRAFQESGVSPANHGVGFWAAWSEDSRNNFHAWAYVDLSSGSTKTQILYSGSAGIHYRFLFQNNGLGANAANYQFYCDRTPWS